MSHIATTEIQFNDNDGHSATAVMQTTVYESSDRITRAAVRLGACWAAAGVTLFIPLAHFVLVPAFLIAGPVMAVSAYRTSQARDHATGSCPSCSEDVEIKLEADDELPKWTYCPRCNAPLQLTLADSPAQQGTATTANP